MRAFFRAAMASAIAIVSVVGPIGAATTEPLVTAQAAQLSGTITGRVVDTRGAAIPHAIVVASGAKTVQTASGTDGRFAVTVSPGLYTLVINKGGYQSAQSDDVVVAAGSSIAVTLTLTEANLQSLRVIGRTSASASRNPINVDSTSIATLGAQTIEDRIQPNLNELVGELPGVFTNRDTTGRTPNSGFVVRGSAVETRVNINGHGVSSGVFGTWNSNYTTSDIFDQVEVVKGAGLTGPNAGESAVGTVNLRTRSFVPGNHAGFSIGTDSFGGSIYSAYANVNTLRDKLSIIAVKTLQGYRGTSDNYLANRTGPNSLTAAQLNPLGGGSSLIAWQGDLSNRYTTQAELVKVRYKLSDVTWLTGEFLGSHGKYQPQGGSYAIYNGTFTVPQCSQQSGGRPTTPIAPGSPGCDATSIYNSPSAIDQIGAQSVPMYDWFPNSEIAYNEPQFDFELRTAIKNDTVLVRPYSALINRFINGQYENYQPGYGGAGWYAVTSAANCVIPYGSAGGVASFNQNLGKAGSAPGTSLAQGPCFTAGQGVLGSVPYVAPGGAPAPPVFAYQSGAAPNCGPVTPGSLPTCYTTNLNQQANGYFGFSTPFSQPEVDRLRGVTFSYIHPVKDNIYNFSFDYASDDTLKQSNDTTTPPAGCTQVIGFGVPNTPTLPSPTSPTGAPVANPAYQPAACSINGIPFINVPQIGLQIPPTKTTKYDYALTAQLQLRPELSLGIGNYLTVQRLNAQVVSPAVLAANGNVNTVFAVPSLIPLNRTLAHYDPHVTLEYRPSRALALRLSGGSGTTLPYAGIISGFPRSNGVSGSNVFNIQVPNPDVKPETTVAFDLGADVRQPDGGVFTIDAFDNTTHNVFINLTQVIPAIPNTPNSNATTTYTQSQTTNGPLQKNYGVEISSRKVPLLGFGYYATATFQRAFLDQLPLSYYGSFTTNGTFVGNFRGGVNGKQLDGSVNNTAIPFAKARIEGNFTGTHGTYLSLGMDWFGANNSYRDTGITLWNAVARTGVGSGYKLQMSVENLFNTSTGNFIGATISNFGPIPVGSQILPNGSTIYSGAFGATTRPNSVQIIPPRNVRFVLSKRV